MIVFSSIESHYFIFLISILNWNFCSSTVITQDFERICSKRVTLHRQDELYLNIDTRMPAPYHCSVEVVVNTTDSIKRLGVEFLTIDSRQAYYKVARGRTCEPNLKISETNFCRLDHVVREGGVRHFLHKQGRYRFTVYNIKQPINQFPKYYIKVHLRIYPTKSSQAKSASSIGIIQWVGITIGIILILGLAYSLVSFLRDNRFKSSVRRETFGHRNTHEDTNDGINMESLGYTHSISDDLATIDRQISVQLQSENITPIDLAPHYHCAPSGLSDRSTPPPLNDQPHDHPTQPMDTTQTTESSQSQDSVTDSNSERPTLLEVSRRTGHSPTELRTYDDPPPSYESVMKEMGLRGGLTL